MSDIKTCEGNWPAQPTERSSPFALVLLHSLTTTLTVFVTACPRREKGFPCCDKKAFWQRRTSHQGPFTKSARKDTNKSAQSTKTSHASCSLSVSSHHIPLLSCHGPSTVRGEHSGRDSRPLGSITQLISWHRPCDNSMPPLPAPNPAAILQEKKGSCHQAHTTQVTRNASLHTLPVREPLEDALSSSDQASPSLSPTLKFRNVFVLNRACHACGPLPSSGGLTLTAASWSQSDARSVLRISVPSSCSLFKREWL